MKKVIAFSAGLLAGGLVCVAIKKTIDKTKVEAANDDETPAVRIYEDLENDPKEQEEFADVSNVKADAINHGYVPVKY
ncbi:hypothetical protein [Lactobacillus sp. LL6]|uniref:hypothetical protein n=1 Tax=Lactobacillus sp. LL6 TaxID=2596827 RepID=UPI001184E6C3|nr:hypothetical protein [Lactobacillus sp. LL6]TSO25489.1 hypothetical protein FOD82_09715 [Lactobacillus sp. LL6]